MTVYVRFWENCFSSLGLWFFIYEVRELGWMSVWCIMSRSLDFMWQQPLPVILHCHWHLACVVKSLSLVSCLPNCTVGGRFWSPPLFVVTVTFTHPENPEFSPSPNGSLGPTHEKPWILSYRSEVQALEEGRNLPKVIGKVSKEPSANLGLTDLRPRCAQHPTHHGCSAYIFFGAGNDDPWVGSLRSHKGKKHHLKINYTA